jgi:hypothetical protein
MREDAAEFQANTAKDLYQKLVRAGWVTPVFVELYWRSRRLCIDSRCTTALVLINTLPVIWTGSRVLGQMVPAIPHTIYIAFFFQPPRMAPMMIMPVRM